MARLARTAKPCNQWTANELSAYNITVVRQDYATFFEMPTPPEPTINPHVSTTADQNNSQNVKTARTLKYMAFVMDWKLCSVLDFALALMDELEYPQRGELLTIRWNSSPLVVCGKNKRAITDLCLLNVLNSEQWIYAALLLVQEVKGDQDPHAPLVAKAIAAFTHNRTCMEAIGLSPPSSTVIAGITLKGTMPAFYKINVSMELATAVREGVYPESPTIVYEHIPDVPGPLSEGMRPLDNRRVIMSCFEAFKKFIK